MRVVPARVHLALGAATEWPFDLLEDWQCIHVGTKADAMAANTSSFAIIFALCMMAVDRAGMGADGLLSAAAQIKLARKPHVFPQLVELADNAIFERQPWGVKYGVGTIRYRP